LIILLLTQPFFNSCFCRIMAGIDQGGDKCSPKIIMMMIVIGELTLYWEDLVSICGVQIPI
ncbi:MAG TPA: hypothetical protein VI037_00600, partial [Nitrososphaera sp.]